MVSKIILAVYSEPDNDDDDDIADYRSLTEIPEDIKEQIKNITEYDKLEQIPKTESDSDLFHGKTSRSSP